MERDLSSGRGAETGPLVAGRSNADANRPRVRSPAFQVARDASAQARMWTRELGLTTDSHARIGLTDPRTPDSREDLLSNLFA